MYYSETWLIRTQCIYKCIWFQDSTSSYLACSYYIFIQDQYNNTNIHPDNYTIREHPFNLKGWGGGTMVFFGVKIIFSSSQRSRNRRKKIPKKNNSPPPLPFKLNGCSIINSTTCICLYAMTMHVSDLLKNDYR